MKIINNIDKLGTIGMFFTAIFSPCCFPLFAFAASALGLGSFELFGGWTMWIFQGMVLISIIGFFLSYRKHKCLYPLLISIPSMVIIFYSYYFCNNEYQVYFLYTGMFGLLIATIVNYYQNKLHGNCKTCGIYDGKTVELKSTITCPKCGHKKSKMMPTNACEFFYECENCKTRLRPLEGDCCVYCSYGSVKCPPIQVGTACC
ncbi:MerC domain-containing protein [Flavobacterium sp. KDG-16]|uniref:MerC domain-containing protein n=1 Tax=Flavobacterium difficile TaxID=2709659 RepID=A0ABX0I5P4_9FLAO|nr:MerC domain-containing protein [Flavobacterium difficile]